MGSRFSGRECTTMLQIDIALILGVSRIVFGDFDAAVGAGRNAGTAASALFQVYTRAGKPTNGEIETDGTFITAVCTTTAHDAFTIQAAGIDLSCVVPGSLPRIVQCVGLTGGFTVSTKRALAVFEINLWIAFAAFGENAFGAGVNTIGALRA